MKYLKKFETNNRNILFFYVRTNNIEAIKELIDNGVNLNDRDSNGDLL